MHAHLKIVRNLHLFSTWLGCPKNRAFHCISSNHLTCSNFSNGFVRLVDPFITCSYLATSDNLLPFRYVVSFISLSTTVKDSQKPRAELDAQEDVTNSRIRRNEKYLVALHPADVVAEDKAESLDIKAAASDNFQGFEKGHIRDTQSWIQEEEFQNARTADATESFVSMDGKQSPLGDSPGTSALSESEQSRQKSNSSAECLSKHSLENGSSLKNIKESEPASGTDGSRSESFHAEGWNASYRKRVEKILVDKGFVGKSEVLGKNFNQGVRAEQAGSHETSPSCNILQESLPYPESSPIGGQVVEKDKTQKTNDASEVKLSSSTSPKQSKSLHKNEGPGLKSSLQASALLRAALDESEEEEGAATTENQRSLEVGIVGAPNSGKSTLLNCLIGTKVSAVSRKTNTTRSEILGVLTEGDTQLLFYDTPGLMLDWRGQALRQDMKNRVQSAWMTADHCELLLVLVDAHRHIEKPDSRVQRLVEKLGVEEHPPQKRILCLNKVDLVKKKKSLLPLAQDFGQLPGFERIFMISSLKGGGVKDLKEFLLDQAVIRAWEEEPETVTDMSLSSLAMEVVWEHVLDNLHQELPYELKHEHVSWKVLRDGSLRIEQKLLVPTEAHKKIVVGKRGENIRKIGMAAHAELNERLGQKVHLFLDVKLSSRQMFVPKYESELDDLMEM